MKPVANAVTVPLVGGARGRLSGKARGISVGGAVGSPSTRTPSPSTEQGHEEGGESEQEGTAKLKIDELDSNLQPQVATLVTVFVADVTSPRARIMHIVASRVAGLPVAVQAPVDSNPSMGEGIAREVPMAGSHVRGAHLHQTHSAAEILPPASMPGGPPRALVEDHATDSDRVGGRQPPPGGGIGGPCKLHCSSGRSETEAAATARHPTAGTAAPRPDARSSVSNPRASGLAADSTARSHSVRVPEKARRQGAPPGKRKRASMDSHAGCRTQEGITMSTLVVTPLTVPVDFSSAAATIVEEGVGVGEVGGVVGDVVPEVRIASHVVGHIVHRVKGAVREPYPADRS